jgi:hypothetical protein
MPTLAELSSCPLDSPAPQLQPCDDYDTKEQQTIDTCQAGISRYNESMKVFKEAKYEYKIAKLNLKCRHLPLCSAGSGRPHYRETASDSELERLGKLKANVTARSDESSALWQVHEDSTRQLSLLANMRRFKEHAENTEYVVIYSIDPAYILTSSRNPRSCAGNTWIYPSRHARIIPSVVDELLGRTPRRYQYAVRQYRITCPLHVLIDTTMHVIAAIDQCHNATFTFENIRDLATYRAQN